LRVEYPKGSGLAYLPGQFFMVSLVDHPQIRVSRAYSVASSPLNTDYIEIGFDKVGVLTTKLFDMKVGDSLKFKGPYGKFFFDPSYKGDVVLIGAGTGITPLMSIIRYCTDKGSKNPITLLYSARTPESIIYRKEFDGHRDKNPHFGYTVTLTRPEESQEPWNGKTGRIDESLLKSSIKNPNSCVVFICGAKEFVFSIIAMLEGIGIKKEQIKTDVWG
ncbi:MAG TPA: FAD-binding oxidoreductase, partial [Candidatus Nanoarchaeia archaeon]|nr:FAD-binding oxidoreductase [Candidatus Nanoarchaeia archaeon]